MTMTERWLITGMMSILMGLGGWLLINVTVNSARISVLENQTLTHREQMQELKDDLREHRNSTERNRAAH